MMMSHFEGSIWLCQQMSVQNKYQENRDRKDAAGIHKWWGAFPAFVFAAHARQVAADRVLPLS